MKRTIDDAKWFCPNMAKKYCSIRLALCVVVCYSFFAFFSARETLRRHKTKIEIEASLAEDEHFVFHKAKLLVGSTKPGKFKHFTDGAPVYVASKRQNGILLGSPFDCPVLLKRERKGEVCAQIYISEPHRLEIVNLLDVMIRSKSKVKKRRLQLARVVAKFQQSPGHALSHALLSTYPDRPIIVTVDETSFSSGGSDRAYFSAQTGKETNFQVCGIIHALESRYGIPRDQSEAHLVVVFGTLKGNKYFNLFLAGFMGNFNMFLMINYLGIEQTIPYVSSELQQLKHLVLLVPQSYIEEACSTLVSLPKHVSNVVLLSLADGPNQPPIICGIEEGKDGQRTNQGRIRTGYLTEVVKNSGSKYKCNRQPLKPFKPHKTMGQYFVARTNPQGKAEFVNYRYSQINTKEIVSKVKSLRTYPGAPRETMMSLRLFPLSSGDTTELFSNILLGVVYINPVHNFARGEMLSYTAQTNLLVGSPVQLRQIFEEYNLKAKVLKRKDVLIFQSSRLRWCFTGGGAPNPLVEKFLVETGHCSEVEEGWGSYESWEIGVGAKNIYSFHQENVVDWYLESFGPYKKEDGKGELLLSTRATSLHPEKHFNKKRYFKKHGRIYLHTRDIVEIVNGVPHDVEGSKISMIDKTTCPFTLLGSKWVRTGQIERAIESDQTVIETAAVFGSERTESIAVVVWLSAEHASWDSAKILQYCQTRLEGFAKAWEVPTVALVADEPWEYRPRAKIRKFLKMKFGEKINGLLPGAVDEAVASDYNLGVDNNAKFTAIIRRELKKSLGGTCVAGRGKVEGYGSVCDMLLACVGSIGPKGGCLLRSGSGKLREPALYNQPYDPNELASLRLDRFDNEPWHFWDMQTNVPPSEIVSSLKRLDKEKETLYEVLPLILPSLGLLHPFGMRFRMRLDCAIRIAKEKPTLFEIVASSEVYRDVYKICRSDFFSPIVSPGMVNAFTSELFGGEE